MPNPAHNLAFLGLFSAGIFLSVSPVCAQSTVPNNIRPTQAEGRSLLDSLMMSAQRADGYELVILTEPGVYNQAAATLTFEGLTWRGTTAYCERVRNAVNAFQYLPLLRPGPGLILPGAGPNKPLAPTRRALSWTIRTQLSAPDGSFVDVEMQGGQGPYANWLDQTIEAIKACGPPVS